MAKKVIWSIKSQIDRKNILIFWNENNKSNSYSIKLNKLFNESVKLIAKYPQIGRLTDKKNVRVKIVRDYLIFYEEFKNEIHILIIWDNRRNPADVTLRQV